MRNAGMIVKWAVLLAAMLVASLPALGQAQIDSDREALFLASSQMSREKTAPPTRQIALFTTTLGSDDTTPVNFGGKLEVALTQVVWVSLEAVYLNEDGVNGLVSLKLYPSGRNTLPLYIGAGASLAESGTYQVYAGIELVKHLYVEAKYLSVGSSFSDGVPALAVGFTLPF